MRSLSKCIATMFLLFAETSCSLFQKIPPQIRSTGSTLPYTQLGESTRLLGRCVEFYNDGSFRTEECPEELRVLFKKKDVRTYDGGYHDLVLWGVNSERTPPGYKGDGGYTVAYESHQVELHFVNFGKTSVAEEFLQKLDHMCRHYPVEDTAAVTEVFAGCGVLREKPDLSAGKSVLKILRGSGRSLGIPSNFKAQMDDSKKAPQCKGSPVPVAVKVTSLQILCQQVVQPRYSKVLAQRVDRVMSQHEEKKMTLLKLEKKLSVLDAVKTKKRDEAKLGEVRFNMDILSEEVHSLDRERIVLQTQLEQFISGNVY